jgi:hypothetical protein
MPLTTITTSPVGCIFVGGGAKAAAAVVLKSMLVGDPTPHEEDVVVVHNKDKEEEGRDKDGGAVIITTSASAFTLNGRIDGIVDSNQDNDAAEDDREGASAEEKREGAAKRNKRNNKAVARKRRMRNKGKAMTNNCWSFLGALPFPTTVVRKRRMKSKGKATTDYHLSFLSALPFPTKVAPALAIASIIAVIVTSIALRAQGIVGGGDRGDTLRRPRGRRGRDDPRQWTARQANDDASCWRERNSTINMRWKVEGRGKHSENVIFSNPPKIKSETTDLLN